jgi:DNA-binding winged helix-turn-helix (wHTH) protein/Tol biopolymer transport system component
MRLRGVTAHRAFVERDRTLRFGPFELSEREGELRKNGIRIKLQEQPFRVLVELVSNPGKAVSREELQQKLWPADTFVDFDRGLNTAIRKLRQALNDDADSPRYIETLAKRGYRFVAPVAQAENPPQQAGEAATVSPARAALRTTSSSGLDSTVAVGRRVWPWVLAGTVATLVLVGVFLAWKGRNITPPLATEQRITANPPEAPVTSAVISPDGKYVAYSDPTGVYIRHIASGETRPLPLPAHFDAVPSSWFPDSTHLLMVAEKAGSEVPCLWKVSILGGNPQNLIENAIAGAVSPNGGAIAFLRIGSDYLELWVSRNDGSDARRIVESVAPAILAHIGNWASNALYTGSGITRLAWSPRGKRIAYIKSLWPSYPDPSMDNRYTLETVDTSGGPPKVLEDSPQLRPALTWAAGGRLFFAQRDVPSNDSSDTAVWSLRVNEVSGEAEGKPVPVSKGIGRIGELSVSGDGKKIVVRRANTQPEVFMSELDPSTHRLQVPRRFALDENINIASAWTPDGHSVLMASNRSGSWKLFRQDLNQVTPEVVADGTRNFILPRLNPDGTAILYLTGATPDDSKHLGEVVEIPLQGGGPPRSILRWPALYNLQCARTPSRLCMITAYVGSEYQLLSFDPDSGQTRNVASYKAKAALNWSLSPDASQVALVLTNSEPKVTFMSLNDKSTREVELKGFSHVNTVDWTANSKSVYVIANRPSGADAVVEVEPSGSQRALLEADKNTRFWWAIQSPDGRHVILEQLTGENNVWMLENF